MAPGLDFEALQARTEAKLYSIYHHSLMGVPSRISAMRRRVAGEIRSSRDICRFNMDQFDFR